MSKHAMSPLKAIALAIFGALFGTFILYTQVQQDIRFHKLKSYGQRVVGNLAGAERKSVNLIPMGYSFYVRYDGWYPRKLEVSREVFYSHVNADGKFKVDEPFNVVFMPMHPEAAALPEMLDLWVWWNGGPLVQYPFGAFLLFSSALVFRNRRRSDA